MSSSQPSLGVIGLGVMGRNLALNALDEGVSVAGADLGADAVEGFQQEAEGRAVAATTDFDAFLDALPTPRNLLVMVPAGPPVDSVIQSVKGKLSEGDLLIDGGNSFFRDTQRRQAEMAEAGLHFFGMGVSGGEEGARHGPSMMPGGPSEVYDRVALILEGMAAKVDGDPCVAHLGGGAAGHYVKMVHNGIEYGLMQILAEAYDVCKRGLGMGNEQMGDLFGRWNEGALQSFLVEITADILHQPDAAGVRPDEEPSDESPPEGATGRYLLDFIADHASQKGTGKWTSQDAMDLGVPTPTIDVAVTSRYLSALKPERVAAAELLGTPAGRVSGVEADVVGQLGNAVHAAFLVTYAQGFALLKRASDAYEFGLDLGQVARIWRGGCIIRAAMLESFRAAFRADGDLDNLLVAPVVAKELNGHQEDIRDITAEAVRAGIPVPAISASLSYLDSYRSAWLPANLVAAQRDYFGAHTFSRVDRDGVFHAQWAPAGL
ncbi:NADP-dependent phosphogluconate dehydrogenase [Rubrivirga sp. S365]|uniref:6-phosphogluconate dehydrogenase, decarboxylating n=1 Tax=Rubrivirga litoralis TaxID=3075598 RepID=A0ABU3BR05_9BACT|nr:MULTISPECIES: NADP-dependent phosphogluconate dehydrogenase [unclassified Rubrivirga]MDT0631723.1 NADP-dependent phosphogluconate dehydrogenase [Rubrivirga sp. F394]MDT7856113.1 NADP-dependent phosphogluconate dehydrogenase [Rubrivirga sp. S365]